MIAGMVRGTARQQLTVQKVVMPNPGQRWSSPMSAAAVAGAAGLAGFARDYLLVKGDAAAPAIPTDAA
jgi:hypothetical protein